MEYSFIQFSEKMKLPDGVYNGRYNRDHALVRIKNCIPIWVTFIGFMKHVNGKDEVRCSQIWDALGITHSNVELLLPAQKINL